MKRNSKRRRENEGEEKRGGHRRGREGKNGWGVVSGRCVPEHFVWDFLCYVFIVPRMIRL